MEKKQLYKFLFLSLFVQTGLNFANAQEDSLSFDSQVLETPETKTEVVPKTLNESTTPEASTGLDEINSESKSSKSNIVSEDELLKPKKRSDNSNIKSEKINESEIYISESDKYKVTHNFKSIKLNDIIEQGLRKNFDQNLRDKKEVLTDLTFEGAKKNFWYPNVKLVLSTDSQLVSLIGSSSRINGTNNSKTPSGSFGLEFADYTLFNWGKDYASYLNTKSSYQRDKEVYSESKREFKLDLIYNFFNLISVKNLEKIKQDQLRQASFIYRLNKEKLTIGKTSQQDYYQARSEYLRSQGEYHEAKMQTDIADENMAYLLADEAGTKYVLIENLDFKKIKISLDESINLALKNNPKILTTKTTLENAERSYEIANKENLPLPKLSMKLGSYKKAFGPSLNQTTYETYSGNGNIELVASINATWDLTGDNGLLNSTKLAKSRMNREIANYELSKNSNYAKSMVREAYKNVLAYQNQMLILEARLPSVQKTFDTVLENYLSGKTKYNDFHLALNDLTETKTMLEKVKISHLSEKINLAKLLGIEDFPGENFEQLAVKIKGK